MNGKWNNNKLRRAERERERETARKALKHCPEPQVNARPICEIAIIRHDAELMKYNNQIMKITME